MKVEVEDVAGNVTVQPKLVVSCKVTFRFCSYPHFTHVFFHFL